MTVLTDVALNLELDAETLASLYLESDRKDSERAEFITDRFPEDHYLPTRTTVRDRSRSFIGVGR